MAQDLEELRAELRARQALAREFGQIVSRAARAVLKLHDLEEGATERGRSWRFPELSTQLSGLLGVAAVATSPREVYAFLAYQKARKSEWDGIGDAILEELGSAHDLPGVAAADPAPKDESVQMEAVRVYLGHVRRLYIYVQKTKEWEHVRHLAGHSAH